MLKRKAHWKQWGQIRRRPKSTSKRRNGVCGSSEWRLERALSFSLLRSSISGNASRKSCIFLSFSLLFLGFGPFFPRFLFSSASSWWERARTLWPLESWPFFFLSTPFRVDVPIYTKSRAWNQRGPATVSRPLATAAMGTLAWVTAQYERKQRVEDPHGLQSVCIFKSPPRPKDWSPEDGRRKSMPKRDGEKAKVARLSPLASRLKQNERWQVFKRKWKVIKGREGGRGRRPRRVRGRRRRRTEREMERRGNKLKFEHLSD